MGTTSDNKFLVKGPKEFHEWYENQGDPDILSDLETYFNKDLQEEAEIQGWFWNTPDNALYAKVGDEYIPFEDWECDARHDW